MFFGSAINNFGLPQFLDSFVEMMPLPAPRESDKGAIAPNDERFTAFVFKIQANMDRAHRDRVAFLRVCSGRYERGMKVRHVRLGRDIRLNNPVQFLAQERTLVEDGFAGDIIGVFDPGIFLIGDTITSGQNIQYPPLPQFPPEHFARMFMLDPMKRKQLKKGLEQLAQEGSIQLFRPPEGREGEAIVGAVGELQFDVVEQRWRSGHGHRRDVASGVHGGEDRAVFEVVENLGSVAGGDDVLERPDRERTEAKPAHQLLSAVRVDAVRQNGEAH